MTDISQAATDVARYTASYNRIEDIVSIYTSDALEQIPESEKWDLVVANVPVPEQDLALSSNIIDYDVQGKLHCRFYGSVKKFMRFVPIKTDDQLDLQALHRVRDRLVSRRTAVINQLRAFLLERGITFRQGRAHLRQQIPAILEDDMLNLTPLMWVDNNLRRETNRLLNAHRVNT